CSETRRGHTLTGASRQALSDIDPKHVAPLHTANFMTQEDIGGDHTDFINDAEIRNAPNTTAARRGSGVPILLVTGFVFGLIDSEPTIRQLYQIAELVSRRSSLRERLSL